MMMRLMKARRQEEEEEIWKKSFPIQGWKSQRMNDFGLCQSVMIMMNLILLHFHNFFIHFIIKMIIKLAIKQQMKIFARFQFDFQVSIDSNSFLPMKMIDSVWVIALTSLFFRIISFRLVKLHFPLNYFILDSCTFKPNILFDLRASFVSKRKACFSMPIRWIFFPLSFNLNLYLSSS